MAGQVSLKASVASRFSIPILAPAVDGPCTILSEMFGFVRSGSDPFLLAQLRPVNRDRDNRGRKTASLFRQ